ncbi:c-type cytochrome [Pedobacter immunditicola]|uniref:c-type cytochrome n=1 Tax=Pedobacter immunditicola TaxID=3133440 RepID=UPI0030A5DEDC
MKKLLVLCCVTIFLAACAGGDTPKSDNSSDQSSEESASAPAISDYDPNRGEGKFKDVKVDAQLDKALALKGQNISDLKCLSCHKLTDEKLVGPGWKDVTKRNTPEWIMNFMTNTDVMIDKDPKVQAMLEICMVRMPNQNLSDEDSRAILEFMRQNDGVK